MEQLHLVLIHLHLQVMMKFHLKLTCKSVDSIDAVTNKELLIDDFTKANNTKPRFMTISMAHALPRNKETYARFHQRGSN